MNAFLEAVDKNSQSSANGKALWKAFEAFFDSRWHRLSYEQSALQSVQTEKKNFKDAWRFSKPFDAEDVGAALNKMARPYKHCRLNLCSTLRSARFATVSPATEKAIRRLEVERRQVLQDKAGKPWRVPVSNPPGGIVADAKETLRTIRHILPF